MHAVILHSLGYGYIDEVHPSRISASDVPRPLPDPSGCRLIFGQKNPTTSVAGSSQHEKLTGNGYPFHLHDQQLHLGARILAVADIFAAITEDRPYRKGMNKEQALAVLTKDAENGAVSSIIVELLEENYETVNAAREKASRDAGTRYRASIGDAE